MIFRRLAAAIPVLPLLALFAAALLVLVLAADAGISFCAKRVAFPGPAPMAMDMPGMSGPAASMPMLHAGGLSVCPVVLALIVAGALLAGLALVALHRDSQGVAPLASFVPAPPRTRIVRLRFPVPHFAGIPVPADGRGLRAPPAPR